MQVSIKKRAKPTLKIQGANIQKTCQTQARIAKK
jgi:hypothetical protein